MNLYTLLDNSMFIVLGTYVLINLTQYYFTKYSVLDTNKLQTAYFNILWDRKCRKEGVSFLDL